MTTILKSVEIEGTGLMKNKLCKVKLAPSSFGKIRFFLNDKEPVEACVDNLISTDHCVSIGHKNAKIILIEHFMAACAFCSIDSLDVYINESELPILDGSSKPWVELFKSAGIEKHKKNEYTVSEPVYYLNGKTHLVVLPDEKLNISYSVNYDFKEVTRRWISYDAKKSNEFIEARTFGFLKDLKKYQLLGFARGVNVNNTVGFTEDGGYTTELRSEHEQIKHKVLDLIGDFYLTGFNPLNFRAQIIVKEAGHAVHAKVARLLKDKIIEVRR